MRRINAQILQYVRGLVDDIVIIDLIEADNRYSLFTYTGPREADVFEFTKTLTGTFNNLEEATADMELSVEVCVLYAGYVRLAPGTNTVIPAFDEIMRLQDKHEPPTAEYRKLSV